MSGTEYSMNPTKQQLEDELSEVEISIDLYIKEIEQLSQSKKSKKRQKQIEECGRTLERMYDMRDDLQYQIERMSNNE